MRPQQILPRDADTAETALKRPEIIDRQALPQRPQPALSYIARTVLRPRELPHVVNVHAAPSRSLLLFSRISRGQSIKETGRFRTALVRHQARNLRPRISQLLEDDRGLSKPRQSADLLHDRI